MEIVERMRQEEQEDLLCAEESILMGDTDIIEHITEECHCEGRRCTHCQMLKCRKAFGADKRHRIGLQSWCTRCMVERATLVRRHPELKWQQQDIKTRFLANIAICCSQCWLWTGHVHKAGYGVLKVKGRPYAAHRISYEIYKGAIPEGLVIDHICCNRACVNPDHLEAVTQSENISRGMRRSRAQASTWMDLYRDLYQQFYEGQSTEDDWKHDAEIRRHRLGLDR